jgi:archaemetzincin
MPRNIIALLLLILLSGCKHSGPYTIHLVVMGKMKPSDVKAAMDEFTKMFPGKQIKLDTSSIPMPAEAWYQPRSRYRAEKLLKALKPLKGDHDLVMGITAKPISTSAHGKDDYGICGFSYTHANVSLTSSFHLDREMFLQTIRHEWGHAALGISHCKHPNCTMNAANGKVENLRGHHSFEGKCADLYTDFCRQLTKY